MFQDIKQTSLLLGIARNISHIDVLDMAHIHFYAFFLFQALTLTNARSFRGDSEKRNLIIGGGEAEKGRYPYMVSFQDEMSHFCGGSLIARDVVLTAGTSCIGLLYYV